VSVSENFFSRLREPLKNGIRTILLSNNHNYTPLNVISGPV
jgi:hypothetical protein